MVRVFFPQKSSPRSLRDRIWKAPMSAGTQLETQNVWEKEFHLWPNTALISSVKRLGQSRLKTDDICRVNDLF